jgi:hypothetical protein
VRVSCLLRCLQAPAHATGRLLDLLIADPSTALCCIGLAIAVALSADIQRFTDPSALANFLCTPHKARRDTDWGAVFDSALRLRKKYLPYIVRGVDADST